MGIEKFSATTSNTYLVRKFNHENLRNAADPAGYLDAIRRAVILVPERNNVPYTSVSVKRDNEIEINQA